MYKFTAVILSLLFLYLINACSTGQANDSSVSVKDIDHFWEAYDSLKTVSDSTKKVQIVKDLYIDRGTEGLHAFMDVRGYDATMWVELIEQYPAFWESVRSNTIRAKSFESEIESAVQKLKKIYPDLKEAKIYFAIGGLNTGGTIKDSLSLIGTEMAAADKTVDASELSNWHQNIFKNQNLDNIVEINIHEYIHTQQSGTPSNLLQQSINEGTADFITELVLGYQINKEYIAFGEIHEDSLKKAFKQDMFTSSYNDWLYNGTFRKTPDLGYYMGYAISKAYYNKASDKSKAIKEIIELNYSDEEAVDQFLYQSDYYKDPINKQALMEVYDQKRPKIISISPEIVDRTDVDPSLEEIKITFSEAMTGGYSLNYGPGGNEHFPISEVKGFSNNNTVVTMELDLRSNWDYEFIITGNAFNSKRGYPIENRTIRFKTR